MRWDGLTSPTVLIGWAVFLYLLFWGLRYLLGVRMFLTCAHRDVRATGLTRQQLEPGQLELLTVLDGSLVAAGFRHLGFAQISPVLTHYDKALPCSVFVNDVVPAYAFVRPRLLPAYEALVELQIQTTLKSGITVATFNTPVSVAYIPPDMRVGVVQGGTIPALVEMHQYRLASGGAGSEPIRHTGLEDAIDRLLASLESLRAVFRERGWTAPTSDSSLDRYTLRGAIALTHNSWRAIGARRKGANSTRQATTEKDRRLLIEADMLSLLAVAEHPERAPGTPWPLIAVVGATALLSWVALGWLWNFYLATLVLAVVAFHEGGHALAMRLFGYRDVHVFFVPLLGAMTVGRSVTASVRDRLAVLLAGPIPGLWLGLLLAVIDQAWYPSHGLRTAARVLLFLNGLNLLPFTPLDGGRALEQLTRPDSVWRLLVHVASALGLLTLAAVTHDMLFTALGVLWLGLSYPQWHAWRLRRVIAARAQGQTDFRTVARITLEAITTTPYYERVRAVTRHLQARTVARLFSDSVATPADRAWGAIAYLSAWIPVAAWLLLRAD